MARKPLDTLRDALGSAKPAETATGSDAPKYTAVDNLPALGTDAAKWADSFLANFINSGKPITADWLTGWFANAIMAGHDAAWEDAKTSALNTPDVVEALSIRSAVYDRGTVPPKALNDYVAGAIESVKKDIPTLPHPDEGNPMIGGGPLDGYNGFMKIDPVAWNAHAEAMKKAGRDEYVRAGLNHVDEAEPFVDLIEANAVEFELNPDGRVWLNVDGVLRARIKSTNIVLVINAGNRDVLRNTTADVDYGRGSVD